MILPTWEEIDEMVNNKEALTPIEQFIYDEMPMEADDPDFMNRLNAALDHAASQCCYCGSENVIVECGSCKERRVFGTRERHR